MQNDVHFGTVLGLWQKIFLGSTPSSGTERVAAPPTAAKNTPAERLWVLLSAASDADGDRPARVRKDND